MSDPALVIGAGLAGLAAAVELARAGFRVVVAEQARAPGGAIHRQPLEGASDGIATAEQRRRWATLQGDVVAQGERIDIRCETRFAGIDHDGVALLAGPGGALLKPAGLILATGATERVRPRSGWTLPGVMTAGAIQIQTKTLGVAPRGRILLAGSGPLLIAVAANLVKGGNPPVAIIEAGRPFSRVAEALTLPVAYLHEAAGYMTTILGARVPVHSATELVRIEAASASLRAVIEKPRGTKVIEADLIGLHDGIRPNDYGATVAPVPVLRAGDCREALGARAALADGRRAGAILAATLKGETRGAVSDPEIAKERAAQERLARIYAHDVAERLKTLPGDTIICRCENRTLDDLRALGPSPTDRQLRLTGRFAMGRCQGRFCADWTRILSGSDEHPAPIGAMRLPVRPIAIADLLAAEGLTEQSVTGDMP